MPRLILLLFCVPILLGQRTEPPIGRRALVDRHQPVLQKFDPEAPLSVGNGEFAFTVDATGLQTFPEAFEQTIPPGAEAVCLTGRRRSDRNAGS